MRAATLTFAIISLAIAICVFVEPVRGRFYSEVLAGKLHGGGYVKANNASIYYRTFGSGPGATHAVPTDKPEIVNSEILKFLDHNRSG